MTATAGNENGTEHWLLIFVLHVRYTFWYIYLQFSLQINNVR